jgi:hypothetical protein
MAKSNHDDPPSKLKAAGLDFWRSALSEYEIGDTASRQLLFQVCCSIDAAASYRAEIERDGNVVEGKEHPLIKCEVAAQAFISRNLTKLGLLTEPKKPMGRPGNSVGWVPQVV